MCGYKVRACAGFTATKHLKSDPFECLNITFSASNACKYVHSSFAICEFSCYALLWFLFFPAFVWVRYFMSGTDFELENVVPNWKPTIHLNDEKWDQKWEQEIIECGWIFLFIVISWLNWPKKIYSTTQKFGNGDLMQEGVTLNLYLISFVWFIKRQIQI